METKPLWGRYREIFFIKKLQFGKNISPIKAAKESGYKKGRVDLLQSIKNSIM